MRKLLLASAVALVMAAVTATQTLHVLTPGESNDLGFAVALLLGFPAFAGAGALILSRQPGNTMGRSFLAVGLTRSRPGEGTSTSGPVPVEDALVVWP